MKWALVVFLLAVAGGTSVILISMPVIGNDYALVDYIEVTSIDPETSFLTFHSGRNSLQMLISSGQGISIQQGIQNIEGARPNTHDLQAEILEKTGVNVLLVGIDSLEEGYYTAKLHVRSGLIASSIDCRPSDCTAIAVRMDAPIYIKSGLFSGEGSPAPAVLA